jgi:hypothetical protein
MPLPPERSSSLFVHSSIFYTRGEIFHANSQPTALGSLVCVAAISRPLKRHMPVHAQPKGDSDSWSNLGAFRLIFMGRICNFSVWTSRLFALTMFVAFSGGGELQMIILKSTRADAEANLYTQLRELERLRDQVKQAEMLARKSQSGGKRTQLQW